MIIPVFRALLATLGTWLATAAGAATVLLLPRRQHRLMDGLLGFAAGVMIAASFWSLLLPALDRAEGGPLPPGILITAGFLAGAAAMWLADKISRRVRRREAGRGLLLMIAITLHNIPEGLAVGVAFGALAPGDRSGLLGAASLALGVGLQNIPEGAAVALPLHRQGHSRGRSFLLGQASALVEPVAGVLGALLVAQIQLLLPWALAFAAGAMIMVSVHELIPNQDAGAAHSYYSSFWVIGGFCLMMLLDVMLS